ncbi:putative pre-mRNA-splicing factor ATP-dependent RNA helicase DHX16 [Vanessa atalanta]|uniref:putative pre-mRNA-splicing factor ATP-dependent RNA helicase DHX16 n=1 Tax=Vanessa atalanta TaxID=42275 RepID=UPI001FCD8D37|nr:putative pre-mRNA-splicing factor ATP-dependent RNA helicase DHX16 [Vanessa atalanta]
MEFSDDSFIWSDASNDSDTMDFDIKQEESDNNKDDNLVEDRSHKQKNKAKKRKYEEPAELNGTVDRKPKVIKSEPDSDFDTPRKKKKKKHHNHNEEIQESDFDDSYLNYKVKQEQVSFLEPAPVKSKKKKKVKKNSESFSSEDLDNTSQEVDADTPKPTEGSQIDDKSITLGEEVVEKKKKKKSKKESSDTIALNDDFEISDENFQAKKKLKRKKRDTVINSNSFDRSEDLQIEEISCINNSALNNNFIDDDQIKETNGDLNFESTKIELNTDKSLTSNNKPSKQVPKILERLKFEDEDSIDSVPKENDDETNLSKHLRSFFNANKKLSLITPKAQAESVITEDDEIWIINGPHELNVKDFKGIHIKLDSKCKLKFNGQSYDSIIDNCITKAPIMSLNKNKLFVKNVPINYSINLRKRIPKAHIPEENVMVNNQINFIPLPETKCRHPLFGINYKKATKISASINERLNNTVTEPSNKEKRKKHKKEKRKVEIESEAETKPETIPVISAKKKRKRKSSMKDEHVAKKAKYIKNELDSTDVWDSEQAIEKNLFDF